MAESDDDDMHTRSPTSSAHRLSEQAFTQADVEGLSDARTQSVKRASRRTGAGWVNIFASSS